MNKKIFLKDIGIRLKGLRGKKTQESISAALTEILGEERTIEAYQHYEAGRRLLPADVLWGLSKIYMTSADWILTGEEVARGSAGAKKSSRLTDMDKETRRIVDFFKLLSNEQKSAITTILKSMTTISIVPAKGRRQKSD